MPKVIDEASVFRSVLELLVRRGYASATTKEIAEAAGINEATLFRKYGSKAELFEKAINQQMADTPLNRLAFTGDLEADLLKIVEAYMATYKIFGPVIPALLVELPRHPELIETLSRPLSNVQNIAHILQQYQEQGDLKPEAPLAAVNALIGPLLIQQMLQHAGVTPSPPEIELDGCVEAFLSGRALPA